MRHAACSNHGYLCADRSGTAGCSRAADPRFAGALACLCGAPFDKLVRGPAWRDSAGAYSRRAARRDGQYAGLYCCNHWARRYDRRTAAAQRRHGLYCSVSAGSVGPLPSSLGARINGLFGRNPGFFDVALILLLPLVYSLAHRTGRSLLYYALPLAAGIAVAHSFVPPTPGPVAVAGLLGADLGWVILFGILTGLPATILGGIIFGQWIAARLQVPVPMHLFDASSKAVQPPPLFLQALSVILAPLVLILIGTAVGVFFPEDHPLRAPLRLLGHPFTALLLGTFLACYLLGVRLGYPMRTVQQMVSKALEPVGLILLVTGAGGVLSRVLVETGVGQALAEQLAASRLPLVILAFSMALAVRVAQGSATVSMVTAAGLIAPIVQNGSYAQPMLALLTLAIAASATAFSHVNDSGFWLVSRYLDLSEADTLRVWTVLETILGVSSLVMVLLLSLLVTS